LTCGAGDGHANGLLAHENTPEKERLKKNKSCEVYSGKPSTVNLSYVLYKI